MSTLSTTPAAAPPRPAPVARPVADHHPLLQPLVAKAFADDREFRHFGRSVTADGLRDFLFAADDDTAPRDPATVFRTLRWGGQFVYASRSRRRVEQLARQFAAAGGFRIERDPASIRQPLAWLPILARHIHYFVARKVQLILPGEITDRFTYQVELARHGHGIDSQYVVCKQVPSVESVVMRLAKKWPDTAPEVLEKRARKFTEKIFPTFLTREAAILLILQEHLPSRYAHRVPRVVHLEKDIRGFVIELRMNWLRNGGTPLSQLEFAMQSADLLRAVHDSAGVIHLDLRMDNMVVTEHGVGFVDFGSAARINENLATNPMLDTLFEELMRTSQIQRMLFAMTKSGEVTAQHLCSQHGKADKAIDLFYLALQFTTPHANPDLAGLIHYDPHSRMAREIAALSATILRPKDPNDATHRSAKDILRSLELIERDVFNGRGKRN